MINIHRSGDKGCSSLETLIKSKEVINKLCILLKLHYDLNLIDLSEFIDALYVEKNKIGDKMLKDHRIQTD